MQGSTRIDELRQKFHENPRRYFAPLANEYRKAGDPEQAIAICRAHLAQQPGHMSGHVVYGQALYDAHRTDEALAVFEKALALDPDNPIVLKQLGDIAREKGDTSEARHWYSRALEADPNDREAAAYVAELAEPVSEAAAPEVARAEPVPDEALAPQAPQEQEVPIEASREAEVKPAPEEEPAPAPSAQEPAATPGDEEASWRKTPPHEESPFVTRTMAELYASQGYRQAALDVYKQLALQHPDDKEIFDRIDALEKEPESVDGSASGGPEAPAPEPMEFEPLISDAPVESDHDTFVDLSDEPVFAPSSEDLNLDIAATPSSGTPHFTEIELSTGDSWDHDSWGAGFGADDEVHLDFDSPDVPAATPAVTDETPAHEIPAPESAPPETAPPETPAEAEQALDVAGIAETFPEPVNLAEPGAEDLAEEPIEEPLIEEPLIEEPLIEEPPVEEPPVEEPPVEERAEEAIPESSHEESAYDSEPEPSDASHVVAYSPQLPHEEELPHYTPKGPTVREFFATLGTFRPSAKEGSTITSNAGIPAASSEPESSPGYPLASDAFASLFSESPVNEEDSRAAFALSGALGQSEPAAAITPREEPAAPPPPAAPVASPAAAQESEEDIRRFREWLDGLADS